jgi:uncharacterized protein (DUF433 family)
MSEATPQSKQERGSSTTNSGAIILQVDGMGDTTIRPSRGESPPGYPRPRLPPRPESLKDLPRIAFDPDKWTGLACIQGPQVKVAAILRWLASGKSISELLAIHPGLQADDIRQALEYAARQVEIPVIHPDCVRR